MWYYVEVLVKAVLFEFLATSENHPNDFYSNVKEDILNPNNILRVGLNDYLSNFAPLFAPDWFHDALLPLGGFSC